jgi:hypothetical protein
MGKRSPETVARMRNANELIVYGSPTLFDAKILAIPDAHRRHLSRCVLPREVKIQYYWYVMSQLPLMTYYAMANPAI